MSEQDFWVKYFRSKQFHGVRSVLSLFRGLSVTILLQQDAVPKAAVPTSATSLATPAVDPAEERFKKLSEEDARFQGWITFQSTFFVSFLSAFSLSNVSAFRRRLWASSLLNLTAFVIVSASMYG